MDFNGKKKIELEDDNTQDEKNIYADYIPKENEEKESMEDPNLVRISNLVNTNEQHTLENNTVLTKASSYSRFLLYGFYLLIIIVGAIAFLMIRSNKYEFYLKKDSVLIDVGSSYQIELTPKNVRYFDYLNYNYSVADESIAKVDEYGTVTAVGYGSTTLKISLKPGLINTKTVKIVSENIDVNSLNIGIVNDNEIENPEYISLDVNQSVTLRTIVNDRKDLNISAEYTSSDTSVVTVDSFGNATAKGEGTAIITAKINETEGSIVVTVGESDTPVTPVPTNDPITPTQSPKPSTKPSGSTVSLGIASQTTKYVGEVLQLTAKVNNAAVDSNSVKWSSSNIKVATISNNGLIRCNQAGTTVITAEVNGVKGTATLIVKNKPSSTTTPKPTATATATSSASAPSGTQFSTNKVQLGKTSLTVSKGSTATFVIKMTEATGTVKVTSSNASIASVTLPKGSDSMPICNQTDNVCFLDGLTKTDEITITVNGVKAGTAYIDVKMDDVQSVDGNTLSGSGKVGILVK